MKNKRKSNQELYHVKTLIKLLNSKKCFSVSKEHDKKFLKKLNDAFQKISPNEIDSIPDFFLGAERKYALEDFEISTYDEKIKRKIQNPKYLLKKDKQEYIKENKDIETGVFSYNDKDISPRLKKGNYSQTLEKFNSSLYNNIKNHGESYKKADTNMIKGFLIYTEVPFYVTIFLENRSTDTELYCIFKDQMVISLLKEYNIEYAFHIIGDNVYFFHNSMVDYKMYDSHIFPLFLTQTIGVNKIIELPELRKARK